MRVVVSGGGSAGHITPTLAVAASLARLGNDIDILYVGQTGGMEARIVQASGYRFAGIPAGKLRRGRSLENVVANARDLARTVQGLAAAVKVLRQFRPDVVFLKGGFVCVPVGLAARLLRRPYVIHESDIVPGLANRILAKYASKIAVGFPVKNYPGFEAAKLVFTGNPVRPELRAAHRLDGLAAFGFRDDLPVILVTGGSQGARQINDVVVAALPELLERYQVLHLTGEGEYERVRYEVSRLKLEQAGHYRAKAFLLDEMPAAMAAADVLVARAGAQTIAEAAVIGKPTVLIPNYQAAAHQLANARVLSRAGAARVLDGSRLTPEQLVGELRRILDDPEEQRLLGQGIKAFGRADAADELANLVLTTGGGAGKQHA